MADEEGEGLEHAKERCSLLKALKYTVERLLMSDLENNWETSDSLEKLIDDLDRILKHGQREQVAYNEVDKKNMSSVPAFEGTISEDITVARVAGLQQALLERCLSAYLLELVNNREQILYCYQEYAFLRSTPHVGAMCTCLEAFEKGDCQLLIQIDNVLLNKEKYIEMWLKGSTDLSFHDDTQKMAVDELSSSEIEIIYSDSTGSSDSSQSVSPFGSPDDVQIDITDYALDCHGEDTQDGFQIYSSEPGQNFSYLPKSVPGVTSENSRSSISHGIKRDRERTELTLGGLGTTEPSRIGQNVKATLAHAALSAVLESDETLSNSSTWFDGQSEEQLPKIRRASTGSLSDNLLHSNGMLETSNIEPGSYSRTVSVTASEPQVWRVLGHYRSKSDQIGVPKSQEVDIVDKPKQTEKRHGNSFSGVSRLSSSLPTTSESLYSSDPFLEDPYEEQSLAEMLASQDFSSCEMDKENAHFSISEALIAAIEQMKCDDVNTSDEEEDDEEIRHLKEELERKRWEKKQGRKLLEQAAFSDETTHSTMSEPSTATTSSKSLCESEDELSPDWEEISPTDEQLREYQNDFRTSTSTLGSTADKDPSAEAVDAVEAKLSPQLSAETVAKSLLQKFANSRHPAASELQWLVSFQDAPQCLLPLPETVAVAPDEVPQADSVKKNAVTRQNSLPCRIRGNSEWAPPRAQIIFHAHKPPRRKTVMGQQNFRCAGCGMAVAPVYMKRFRYCHYLGKYFCSSCHNNFLEVIPAKVIRKWDFTKYEVSNFAKDLLQRIHFDPLFDLMDLNPSLYKRLRFLEGLKDIRQQLHFFKTFMQTCRKANELNEAFNKLPDHICGEPHLYSMHDLLQARDGDLLLFLRSLAIESLNHINQCQLCLAKGFICEYCKNGDDVIFPFQLNRVAQCSGCRASFHKECFVAGKCPKCERIRIRKQMLSEPVTPEEHYSAESLLR